MAERYSPWAWRRAAWPALSLLLLACGCGGPAVSREATPAEPDLVRLRAALAVARPLAEPLPVPQPGDWLDLFPEPKQSFDQYLETNPTTARGARRVLYVEPLGEFSPARRRIVELAAEFMGHYFGLPVVVRPGMSLAVVPSGARRPGPVAEQIQAGHVLEKMLLPGLPKDAAAYIALTTADLYPDASWNFVFGVANLRERVGVWSLARYGDPEASKEAFRLCLLRTLKVATHETGHMFSLPHCSLSACAMNGSNGLEETDRHPVDVCPECAAKLCWATGADPAVRLRRVAAFFDRHGLLADRLAAERCLRALEAGGLAPPSPPAARDAATAAALETIEAQHAVQAAALARRDFAAYWATVDPELEMRLTNGFLLKGDAAHQLVRDSMKLVRAVDRVTLSVEEFAVEDDEAVALVRHEFDKTAVREDGVVRRASGALLQRETWARTSAGWRLRKLEEGAYE